MTYNFDPDKWFDNEMAALNVEHSLGKHSDCEFEEAKSKLVEKYEQMLDRLSIQVDYPSEKTVKTNS